MLCGTPESSPRSPYQADKKTEGSSASGKTEWGPRMSSIAEVGRNSPRNPSCGSESGILMTPVDVKFPSCGRKTTSSSKTTSPEESRTMKDGA